MPRSVWPSPAPDTRRCEASCSAGARNVPWPRRCCVVHDAETVLRVGLHAEPGIALIAGTGSLAFGRTAAGHTARAGGWGQLLGDEGSGYAIGLAGLRAVVRAADGRGAETLLTRRLLERLELQDPGELVTALHTDSAQRRRSEERGESEAQKRNPTALSSLLRSPLDPLLSCTAHRVAECAPVVLQAAADGDAVARQIREQAAQDLSALAEAVARSLDLPHCGYRLVFSGGILQHHTPLREAVIWNLAQFERAPQATTVVDDPAAGAVLLAQDLLG